MSGLWGWICWCAQIRENTLRSSRVVPPHTRPETKKAVRRQWSECLCERILVPAILSISPVPKFWRQCLRAWLTPERRGMCTCIYSDRRRSWAHISPSWGEDILQHWAVSTGRRLAVCSCWNNSQIASPFSLVFLFHFGAAACSMELKAL